MQKITPFLWFDDKAEETMNFYTSIFRNSKVGTVTRYGEGGPGPQGTVMSATFQIEGQEFMALNGGPHFTFSPAISSRRREGSEITELFYRGTFTCTREFPGAFKRRDALIGKSKRGIFISHNVPEAKLPIAFKEFLRLGLGADYPVFVSSDFNTIQGGNPPKEPR